MKATTFAYKTFFSWALCLLCNEAEPIESLTQSKINAEEKQYDVIIVPGTPYKYPKLEAVFKSRMLWAKYLFENKITENIIFSGGAVYTPYIEAKIMKLYADALNIPSKYTFAECKAEHSTENVFYSVLMAHELGFKKIAIATDHYQALIIKNFMKKNCPEVDLLLIDYKKIKLITSPWPEIEPSSAKVENFVALPERESVLKRFNGTLGNNMHFNKVDTNGVVYYKTGQIVENIAQLYDNSSLSISTFFSNFK